MDFIRGISALLVCAGHLRAVMFLDYAELKSPDFFSKPFYFFTSLGHEAVIVFFVLSGFFVGGSVLSKKLKFKFDGYLIARLSRLWTALLPALLFTFFIDLLVRIYFPELLAGAYYDELTSGPHNAFSDSLVTFFGNMAFVQTIYVPVYGTNGPLWSLTSEFWFYITFPLMMMAFGVINGTLRRRIIAIVIMAAVIYFFTLYVFGGYLIWLGGVLVYLVYLKKPANYNHWFPMLAFVLFMGALLNAKMKFIPGADIIHPDYFVAFGFSIFLISLQRVEKLDWVQKSLSKIAIWLSDISYTLYVVHFPALMLVYGFFYQNKQVELSAFSLFSFFGWLLVIIVFSRGFWWVFERNTSYIRTYMFKFRNFVVNGLKKESS